TTTRRFGQKAPPRLDWFPAGEGCLFADAFLFTERRDEHGQEASCRICREKAGRACRGQGSKGRQRAEGTQGAQGRRQEGQGESKPLRAVGRKEASGPTSGFASGAGSCSRRDGAVANRDGARQKEEAGRRAPGARQKAAQSTEESIAKAVQRRRPPLGPRRA